MTSLIPPHRRRCARPVLAVLEGRILPSNAPGPFAVFSGTLNGSRGQSAIPITISPADFHLAKGHVLLGLDMETPDRLRIVPDALAHLRTLAPRDAAGYSLMELSAGTYTLHVAAGGSGGESYRIAVSLAGATSSAYQVGAQDLATIRSLEGQRKGAPGYDVAADVNRDGVITARDLMLARRNLGAATTIRPLAVTLGLDASMATTASGAVYHPSVIVAGQTAPGAHVVLYGITDNPAKTTLSNDPGLVPVPTLTTTADAAGHYEFAFDAAVGASPLRVVATDGFGQQATASVQVTRIVDTTPPAIVLQSPTTGSTANDNITVSGRVTDGLTGVATLQAQIDSGPFEAVTVDPADDFRFATTLALDGTADGTHTVVLQATDGAGNVATTSTTFTLTTTLVNRAVSTDPNVQQQPSIAADPLDPSHLVLAYQDRSLVTTGYAGIAVAVSHDSGADWQYTSVPLPAGFGQGAANPIVRFDGQGHVFISFMAVTYLGPPAPLTNPNFDRRGASGIESNNGIFVSRSDDGGLTWNQPATVVSHTYTGAPVDYEDNPDLAIDTFETLPDGSRNPHYGELYEIWTRVYAPGHFPGEPDATGGTDIMFSVSRDGGQTWQLQLQTLPASGVVVSSIQDPLSESGEGVPLGLGFSDQPHVAVGPEGDLYVEGVGAGDFVVEHSTDDGRSFSTFDHATGEGIAFGLGELSFPDGNGLPTNHFRTNPVNTIAADPTRPGTVYAMATILVGDALGNIIDSADVRFARSTDYGLTWQTTFMVGPYTGLDLNDDNHGQSATGGPDDVITGQTFARLTVDAQGNIAVIWYDTRRDPANHLLDVFGTVSTDGGLTFSPNFRITDQSFDADLGKFTDAVSQPDYYLGDYLGLSVAGGTAYAAWTDTRQGNQDIDFTHFPINPAPAPPSDRFAPNNTPATATELGTITSEHVPKLAVPSGESEWFGITAASTGNLTVTATPSNALLRLQVQLWGATGATLLASGSAVPGQSGQQLVFAGQSGKSYLIHVESAPGAMDTAAVSPEYALDIASLTADLGMVVFHDQTGSLEAGDQAYYRLVTGASGSLVVMLTPGANLPGDVNLQVLDPVKRTLLSTGSLGTGGIVTASLAVQQGQALLVRVSGGVSTAGDYSLQFMNLDQFATSSSPSLVFPAGAGPSTVATADLTGNGKLDLVVADALSNTVSVLMGNGDGTFQAPRQYAVGAFKSPNPIGLGYLVPNFRRQVVIADLNRDGIPDIAVTNYDSGDISILLGRGDGTFEPQRRFDATTAPFDVAVGDFNGDGIPDLAVIDAHGNEDSTVAILLGRGDGTFLPEETFPALTGSGYPFSTLTVADLNHDGKEDLVVSGSNFSTVSVFLGNGDGTFRHAEALVGARQGGGAAVLDLNGDGIPDIVTAGVEPATVDVNLGNSDGTYGPPTIYPSGQGTVTLAVADLGSQVTLPDGSTVLGPPDGHPDVIVADGASEASAGAIARLTGVYVLPGLVDDKGNFAGFGSPFLLAPGLTPESLALGNFTGNGATDIAFTDQDGVHVIYQKSPAIPPNDTPQTARDLGTVVHIVEPTQTIVPGHEDAYYDLTAPTETAHGSSDEVIDFSGDFQATTGAGLMMEVLDGAGNIIGSGEHFQITAAQGETLILHVFGATASDGTRGAGAYTLDIDVLPQVVSVEAQTLLPGQGGLPGGATASLVVTLQGDRLDPAAAENPSNYTVTWLGPDGKAGTSDDQVIPLAAGFQSVVYDPSANIDVASGTIHPTAVRQTVTLLFSQPLPAGSYQITFSPAIQAAPFSADESSMLTGGHPLVSVTGGNITSGALVTATDLVLASGALGNLNTLKSGNAFLTQLHDDLSALLDQQKTAQGGQAQITPSLIDQVLNRLEQGLGAPGQRKTTAVALVFDPVSIGVEDPSGDSVDYSLQSDTLTDDTTDSYVDVDGNIEVVILFDPPTDMGDISVTVGDVPSDASGAAVVLGTNGDTTMDLTDDLDSGMTDFDIPPD
jgi:hypothetical protein